MASNGARPWLVNQKGLWWFLAIVLLSLFWIWRGQLYQAQASAPDPSPPVESGTAPPRVEVAVFEQQHYRPELVLQGQLLPARQLMLRSQINATVHRLPALGAEVGAGELLLELSVDQRQASLDQARAELALRQAELNAARKLRRNNLVSETNLLSLQSAAAAAEAALAVARLELEHTRVRAPFAGVVERLPVELGTFLQPGDELLALVDVSRLKMTAMVPQQQVGGLMPGMPVRARLLDGRQLDGTLTFVASAADQRSRSFALEAELDNPERLRVAGASASLHIGLAERQAHPLSPSLLTLDDQGYLGVTLADEQNRVRQARVELLSITPDQAWVAGLPPRIRVITRGAGFVAPGQQVAVIERQPDFGPEAEQLADRGAEPELVMAVPPPVADDTVAGP